MIARPALVPVATGFWLVLFTIGLIVDPRWQDYLPSPAGATLTLREAPYLDRDLGCWSSTRERWQEIARSPNPFVWYRELAAEAVYPAGRLYGWLGMLSIAPSSIARDLSALPPEAAKDSVTVITSTAAIRVPLSDLIRPPVLDSLIRELTADSTRAEC